LFSAAAVLASVACSRHADIADEQDGAAVVVSDIPRPEAGIPVVDAGLDAPTRVACTERKATTCEGANDFPCNLPRWVAATVEACSAAVACAPRGWLSVYVGPEGCVETVGMTDSHPELLACLGERYASSRCTCGDFTQELYLGLGAAGCAP
jgi:hypothetical protein